MKKARLIRMDRDKPVHPGAPTTAEVNETEVEEWMRAGWQVVDDVRPALADAETITAEAQALALPDIELVSAAVHASWMKSKLDAGIKTRLSETGEELMVPYGQLSEAAKELDRATVRTVYAAIEAARLGPLPLLDPSIEREAPGAGDPVISVASIARDEAIGQPTEPDTHHDEKASQAEGTAEADGTGADASAPQTVEATGKKGGRK